MNIITLSRFEFGNEVDMKVQFARHMIESGLLSPDQAVRLAGISKHKFYKIAGRVEHSLTQCLCENAPKLK